MVRPDMLTTQTQPLQMQQPQQLIPKQDGLYPKQTTVVFSNTVGLNNRSQTPTQEVKPSILGVRPMNNNNLQAVDFKTGVTVGEVSPGSQMSPDLTPKSNMDASLSPPVPYMFGRARKTGAVLEKVIERRQKRMIKNRESAARSRARKQAYTLELEAEVAQLKETNEELHRKQVEIIEKQKKQLLEPMHQPWGCKRQCLRRTSTGEVVSAEDLGGATVHCNVSGVSDYFAQDELHGLAIGRNIVKNLHMAAKQGKEGSKNVEYKEPLYDITELRSIAPVDHKQQFDVRSIIARIVDGSEFDEFKKQYGTTLVTGFARIYGQTVGIIGNNGILFNESALKGAHFIELCSQRKIPLVFLQNITGFMVGSRAEANGIAKSGAKMVMAVSCAKVPKITIITGASFGAGNYAMCGRAFSPDFMFMWPNARIGIMGGPQAAGVLSQIERATKKRQGVKWTEEEEELFKKKTVDAYEREASAYFSTARLWDDGVIDPSDTRKILAMDVNRENYELGLPIIEKAGVAHKIDFREGPALPVLDELVADEKNHGTYDFIFVDADKDNYINYHKRLIDLVKVGGVIGYDNTLWNGSVVAPPDAPMRKYVRYYRDFVLELNKALAADPRIEICMLPVGDGITICRRIN
ncbi:hypothetical protein F2Q69_00057884 [Brassica cretica]|uniref:BZIP domain-containing protein n=1 Tax=Brassica cretica TaxID=69181 RepID=A0A8S9MZS9_BRACR|nr:hypothetical protein F2Q69_00057884 [Brassica cretica]